MEAGRCFLNEPRIQSWLKTKQKANKNTLKSSKKWSTGKDDEIVRVKINQGTSLVVQWLRIHLPTQRTWVQALVREDPTHCRATKTMCHNYWACTLEPARHNYWVHMPQLLKPTCHNYWAYTLEPTSHNYWVHMPQLLKPTCLEPVLRNKRNHCNEKPAHCNEE